jgi:Cupin
MPANAAVDQPLRTIDEGIAKVGIFIVYRPQEPDQGCTIEHDTLVNDKTTSIFLVLDGAGTLVTGGKLANPVPLSSDDPDLKLVGSGSRGDGIQNGRNRRISKGDVVIIPAGVPHGFSAIEKSITYEAVRIDSGKTLPLK